MDGLFERVKIYLFSVIFIIIEDGFKVYCFDFFCKVVKVQFVVFVIIVDLDIFFFLFKNDYIKILKILGKFLLVKLCYIMYVR